MGGGATGAGLGIMGGIMGGIGDIMSAANYERPKLPEPGDQESALRRWAQNYIRGGGQQLQGATNLYNEMSPILLSQLPGMSMVPAGPGETGMGGDPSALGSYQDSLKALQAAQARQLQIDQLKRQKTTAKGKDKKGVQKQLKALNKEKKGSLSIQQLERNKSNIASTPPSPRISYGGSQGGGGAPGQAPQQDTLSALQGLMDGLQGGSPDLQQIYQGAMG